MLFIHLFYGVIIFAQSMFLFKNHRWVISPRNLIAYLHDIDVLEYESFDTNGKVMENPTGLNENLNTSGKEELILDS